MENRSFQVFEIGPDVLLYDLVYVEILNAIRRERTKILLV
jgi:hypothetical protein